MVTAYPVAGKAKSRDLCTAFIRGCGGQLATSYRPGPAFFYGVDESNVEIWDRVREAGDPFYYCDNSYFDARRQVSFRISRDRLQHSGYGSTTGKRFAALGIELKPWREAGAHVVLCPQSEWFMRTLARYPGDWEQDALARLQVAVPTRELRIRSWSPNKGKLSATLEQDLEGAHALVTWSSAAAVTAILNGIPAIAESEDMPARALLASDPADVEGVTMIDDRARWAGVLADNEWTVDEMANGTAWRMLHGC